MTTKLCTSCEIEKPLDHFHRKAASADGHATKCKFCCSAAAKKYYKAAPEKYKASARKSLPRLRERNRQFVWGYLQEHPCVDCGCDEVVVLQFDHNDGEKIPDCEVSTLVRNGVSIKRIEAEIAKCEVRCAHCHIKRTYIQFGWVTPPDFQYVTMVP